MCNLYLFQLLKKEEEAAPPAEVKAVQEEVLTTLGPAANTEATANLIDKEDADAVEEELTDDQPERQQLKRDLKPAAASSKQSYNNWFGRNDWSRRIQKVQGRIRFKNQNSN